MKKIKKKLFFTKYNIFFKELSCPEEFFEIPSYVKRFYGLKIESELNENSQMILQNAYNLGRAKRFFITGTAAIVYGVSMLTSSFGAIGMSISKFNLIALIV